MHANLVRMSRSAADATRFTATSPHVYSKSSIPRPAQSNNGTPRSPAQSHRLPGSQPDPSSNKPLETPAQKVARLRAAHAAKRASEISSWDRIVVRGRIIGDAAHRITVLGLIGLTGVYPFSACPTLSIFGQL